MRNSNAVMSESRPIRRNLAEKEKQLKELRDTLKNLKPQTSPALKHSIRKRISELNEDILRSAHKKHDHSDRTVQHKVYALYSD